MWNRKCLLVSLTISLFVSAVTIGVFFRKIYLYEKAKEQRPFYCTHPRRLDACLKAADTIKKMEECEKNRKKNPLCELHEPKSTHGLPFVLTKMNYGVRGINDPKGWGIDYSNAVKNFLIYLIISYPIVLFFNRKKKNT